MLGCKAMCKRHKGFLCEMLARVPCNHSSTTSPCFLWQAATSCWPAALCTDSTCQSCGDAAHLNETHCASAKPAHADNNRHDIDNMRPVLLQPPPHSRFACNAATSHTLHGIASLNPESCFILAGTLLLTGLTLGRHRPHLQPAGGPAIGAATAAAGRHCCRACGGCGCCCSSPARPGGA